MIDIDTFSIRARHQISVLTMCVLQIVLTGVAYIQNVSDSQSCDHIPVFRVLPFAQVEFLWEHFIAKFFRNFWLRSQRLLVFISYKVAVTGLIMLERLQADVGLRYALLLQGPEKQQAVP